MKIEKFEPLIITNDGKNFIRHGRNRESVKFYRELFLKQCPLNVIDKESLRLIQVLQLHKAIDHTRTATGSAVLLRSLTQPSVNLHYSIQTGIIKGDCMKEDSVLNLPGPGISSIRPVQKVW